MEPSGLNVTQFIWLLLIAFIVAVIARRIRAPYALALVITGLGIGIPRLMPKTHLAPSLLFTVFLPPLLFESAIHLRADELRSDWKPIALFTLVGTVASTFIIGALASRVMGVPLAAALVFGALISTTDPISVIAVFKNLGIGRRLRLIMEAESLFNNDVAVVLFTVMMGATAGGHVSIAGGIAQFFRLVLGGALLGIAIGAAASRIHAEIDDHLIELALTTVVAFGSYLCAETFHVSGVMAVIAAGIVVGNYAMETGMSPGTRLAVHAFWEYAAFVVNSVVFLLIGIEVGYVHWTDKIVAAAGAVAVVLVGRSAIYPLSILVNRFKGGIPRSWRHVLFWGGLRGALSMALVLGLSRDFPQRDTLVAGTFGVVLFSLLVQGMTLGPLLKRLGLAEDTERRPGDRSRLAIGIVACRAALAELDRLRMAEAHPIWSVEALVGDYCVRLAALEREMDSHEPNHEERDEEQAVRIHRSTLMAEKSAFLQARRDGWLDEEAWRRIAERIDRELDELGTPERKG